MKKLILILFLGIGLFANSQSTLNSGITVTAQQSVDAKQYKFSAGKHVPWLTPTEFLTTIPSTRRHVGQVAYVANGPVIETWQFVGGITDISFKKVSNGVLFDSTSISARIDQKVDSSTLSNDSLYNWVNGISKFVGLFATSGSSSDGRGVAYFTKIGDSLKLVLNDSSTYSVFSGGSDDLNTVTGRDSVTTHSIGVVSNNFNYLGLSSLGHFGSASLTNNPFTGGTLEINRQNGAGFILDPSFIPSGTRTLYPLHSGAVAVTASDSSDDPINMLWQDTDGRLRKAPVPNPGLQSIQSGFNTTVDNTDPLNPIVDAIVPEAINPIAGTNMNIINSYPNVTFNALDSAFWKHDGTFTGNRIFNGNGFNYRINNNLHTTHADTIYKGLELTSLRMRPHIFESNGTTTSMGGVAANLVNWASIYSNAIDGFDILQANANAFDLIIPGGASPYVVERRFSVIQKDSIQLRIGSNLSAGNKFLGLVCDLGWPGYRLEVLDKFLNTVTDLGSPNLGDTIKHAFTYDGSLAQRGQRFTVYIYPTRKTTYYMAAMDTGTANKIVGIDSATGKMVMMNPSSVGGSIGSDPLKLNIADTATMLTPYITSDEASATYQPIGSYLTANQTITLTGAVTGIGSTSINTVYDTTDASLKALIRSIIRDSSSSVISQSPFQLIPGVGGAPDTLRADTTTMAGLATQSDIALKANIASPTFTGTVTLPAGQVVNGVTLTTAGGTINFLRADGTYAAPPGGGGGDEYEDVAIIHRALGSGMIAQKPGGFGMLENNTTNITLVDNRVYYLPIVIKKDTVITGVKFVQQTAGAYTADQTNSVGLYSYSGGTLTKVAESTNDGNLWKTTAGTVKTAAFTSSYTATKGVYYVAMLYNNSAQTTAPILFGTNAFGNGAARTLDHTNSAKLLGFASGNTLPATQAMSGVSSASDWPWYMIY